MDTDLPSAANPQTKRGLCTFPLSVPLCLCGGTSFGFWHSFADHESNHGDTEGTERANSSDGSTIRGAVVDLPKVVQEPSKQRPVTTLTSDLLLIVWILRPFVSFHLRLARSASSS